jgi:hypothetical protein
MMHGPLETVHARAQNVEEVTHDAVPFLGVEGCRVSHGLLDVTEQDRDLFAFTLDCGSRVQDLLGEVRRRLGRKVRSRPSNASATLGTELRTLANLDVAARAQPLQRLSALCAELRARQILRSTGTAQ